MGRLLQLHEKAHLEEKKIILRNRVGNSLMAQWLEFSVLTARAWVQSLVGELRSHKLSSKVKKKKKRKKERNKEIGVSTQVYHFSEKNQNILNKTQFELLELEFYCKNSVRFKHAKGSKILSGLVNLFWKVKLQKDISQSYIKFNYAKST